MSWIKDLISPKTRQWEDFYRNRWQHDKVVRTTHGANCTGSCSWQVFVKNGIVVWETQSIDYPIIDKNIPPYEPRGCQRGISASWYLYSPVRIKYPMIRGVLFDLYKAGRESGLSPIEAWSRIQENQEQRSSYQIARGKGGLRRASWDEALEMMAAANLYTVKKYGPDRLAGFSPIPAMSMISYAGGVRFLQLMGGLALSFYDWYCDLPPAFPEIWGEQTDVAESADWFHSKFIVAMGSNVTQTRTPDVHFFAEAKHNGTKTVVFSPDFNAAAKYADEWMPVHAGQDGAFWMAVTHVILQEYHHEKKVPYFLEYSKKYTDSPFLIELLEGENGYEPGQLLRAGRLQKYSEAENNDWKFLVINEKNNEAVCPGGSSGHRWDSKKGNWNMKYEDPETGLGYEPLLSFLDKHDEIRAVNFTDFTSEKISKRGVPVRFIETSDGKVPVTTVYDLIMAQYGVSRGLDGDYPSSYEDKDMAYTPAWQEIYSGISQDNVLKFAREWSGTAEATDGKCMILIGAGINHWYHGNLIYRAAIMTLMLTGCIGKNGGGMNHYVGQEKCAPIDSWSALMSAKDWLAAPRLQQAPIWHYMNSDQWRYDGKQSDYNPSPKNNLTDLHTADMIVKAVKNGWLPFYPQYNKNTLDITEEAKAQGAADNDSIKKYLLDKIKTKEITYSVEDPDNEVNFPRVWYIWRGNALFSSAKGHEFYNKHYLGTHHKIIADEVAKDLVKDVKWQDKAPVGKMDLIVDLNFRMDSSALYSDIILPAAMWYEKKDLNTTDMHSFIHPLGQAVAPSWEAKSDWAIFREICKATSDLAPECMPDPVLDIVNTPIAHDSPGEIAQRSVKDWSKGECEMIPGKTMHNLVFVERDYTQIYNKFISLGKNIRNGLGAHGNSYNCEDFYDKLLSDKDHINKVNGEYYPAVGDDEEAINMILTLSSVTNGELGVRAYANAEVRTGLKLTDLAEGYRNVRMNFNDLQSQPKRYHSSPVWSGVIADEKTYAGYTYNYEKLVPWRTLTGRQHFYLDHEMYIKFGENLPTFKPSPLPSTLGDLKNSEKDPNAIMLNVLTPHGKWQIHTTYSDNIRMLTLSRGMVPCWMSEVDAEALGVKDNDWVEAYNDYGVYNTRVIVSSRIPKGMCYIYHGTDSTYSSVKSEIRGKKRGGSHNSITRARLKPSLMAGGYGQFTYHFNYWGPVGVNRDTFVMVRKMKNVEM